MADTETQLKNLDKKFDRILGMTVANEQRFDRLIAIVATKDDAQVVADRLEVLEERVARLVTAVDGITKGYDDLLNEYAAIKVQLARYEKWFEQISQATGVKLEH